MSMTPFFIFLQSSWNVATYSSSRLLIYHNIKAFFTQQKHLGNLLQNPCDHVQLPKREKRLPQHVPTDREVKALINIIPKERYRDRALLELLYGSGIRRSEAANPEVEDIDFDRQLLKVKDVKSLKERMVHRPQSAPCLCH